jgi:hypothetical protein
MTAMADTFIEMQNNPAAENLTREDWLGLHLDRQVTARKRARWPAAELSTITPERGCRGHALPCRAWPASRGTGKRPSVVGQISSSIRSEPCHQSRVRLCRRHLCQTLTAQRSTYRLGATFFFGASRKP